MWYSLDIVCLSVLLFVCEGKFVTSLWQVVNACCIINFYFVCKRYSIVKGSVVAGPGLHR